MTVVEIVGRHWQQDDYQDMRDHIEVVLGKRESVFREGGGAVIKRGLMGIDYLVIGREYGGVLQRVRYGTRVRREWSLPRDSLII